MAPGEVTRMADFRAMEHEEALIRAFITPNKRQRYLDKLGSPKTRQKFMSENLHHMGDLDELYAEKLDPYMPLVEFEKRHEAHVSRIHESLRHRGAPSRCYVIFTGDLDGNEADLRETLETVVGSFDGTFISCVPGRLAYFEGEDENDRYILQRSE